MRRCLLAVAAAAATLGGAGAAQAENKLPAGETRVFHDAALGRASPAAKWEVTRVQKDCAFRVMSREGPSVAEMERCDASISKLVRRGAAAAPAVLAALDDEKTEWGPRHRLYDVLARTADARLVEPLIRGMARIVTRDLGERSWEVELIDGALGAITHADLGQRAPWITAPERASSRLAMDRTVAWRQWQDAHAGLSHAQMLAARLAEARAHAEDADPEVAYRAVAYLLENARVEGIASADRLLAREDLPERGRSAVSSLRQVAAREQSDLDEKAEQAALARAAAGASKATPTKPFAKKAPGAAQAPRILKKKAMPEPPPGPLARS